MLSIRPREEPVNPNLSGKVHPKWLLMAARKSLTYWEGISRSKLMLKNKGPDTDYMVRHNVSTKLKDSSKSRLPILPILETI